MYKYETSINGFELLKNEEGQTLVMLHSDTINNYLIGMGLRDTEENRQQILMYYYEMSQEEAECINA